MTSVTRIITLSVFGLTLAGLIWLVARVLTGKKELPVLGEPGHVAGQFAFTNQAGQVLTEKDVAEKVTVAEYFFTTCPGICKVMNSNLAAVYQAFKGRNDFVILSHTVDPETDSVQVLAEYGKRINATLPTWELLTGPKEDLYKAARQDYLLAVEDKELAGTAEDFIHTEYVALLDKERRIRGFYDATNKESIQKLITGIRELLAE